MFYEKYLDDFYLEELFQSYDIDYLRNVDEKNFEAVYQVLKKFRIDYIEDIILGYLDIFGMKPDKVEEKLLNLKKALGENFIEIIGNDLSYLEYVVRGDSTFV